MIDVQKLYKLIRDANIDIYYTIGDDIVDLNDEQHVQVLQALVDCDMFKLIHILDSHREKR